MDVDANALFSVRLPYGVPYNDVHWEYVQRYYSKYDDFLLVMYKALEGANIEITIKNAALNEVDDVIKTMTRLAHDMSDFMKTYHSSEGDTNVHMDQDVQLVELWETRIDLYRVARESMRSALTYFKECEAMFVFSDRIGRFMERSDPGIIVLLQEMDPKVEARQEWVDKYYAAVNGDRATLRYIGARVSVLDQQLSMRMRTYDEEEDVRAAYVAMTNNNNNNNNSVKVKIEDALTVYHYTTEEIVEEFDIETNSQALESLHKVLASTEPTLLYHNNQLVPASGGLPVTSLKQLDIDDVTRARMEMHRAAPRDLRESEYITDSQRLIALISSAIDMEKFLRANISHVISTATTMLDISVFAGFRVAIGNCTVHRVTLEGRPVEVLVATREVKKGAQLYRDYSDGELYKIWEAYHDTSPVVGRMPRSQKLRQYVGGLQMQRLDALGQRRTEEATDLAIRIKILSGLIA